MPGPAPASRTRVKVAMAALETAAQDEMDAPRRAVTRRSLPAQHEAYQRRPAPSGPRAGRLPLQDDKQQHPRDRRPSPSRGRGEPPSGSQASQGGRTPSPARPRRTLSPRRGGESKVIVAVADEPKAGGGLFAESKVNAPALRKGDRGPFGQGPAMSFGESKEKKKRSRSRSRRKASRSSGSDKEQSFRGASSSSSQHLRLVQYSLEYEGRLAGRLLQKMSSLASRDGGAEFTKNGQQTPSAATPYYLMITVPQLGSNPNFSVRTRREMKVFSKILDLLAAGHPAQAADVVAQRLKALERFTLDGHWRRAQHLELLSPEHGALLDKDEDLMLAREAELDMRLQREPGQAPRAREPRGEEAPPRREGNGRGGGGRRRRSPSRRRSRSRSPKGRAGGKGGRRGRGGSQRALSRPRDSR